MKAIVSTRYGTPEIAKLKDVEKPTWHWRTIDDFLIRLAAGMFKPTNTILDGELPPIWWRGG
jgi:hypothetical protein